MLVQYLNLAVNSLQSLIEMTSLDMEDIKVAAHSRLFERAKNKEEILLSFENYKNLIDETITQAVTANPHAELEDLLNDTERGLLEQMKAKLTELKGVNRSYAKLVAAVGSFYNGLLEAILSTQSTPINQYAGSSIMHANIFHATA
ncbi:MAG: hypothetical protein RL154_1102 [Pseudomonadota bacterium]|jgi:hypothetical protein